MMSYRDGYPLGCVAHEPTYPDISIKYKQYQLQVDGKVVTKSSDYYFSRNILVTVVKVLATTTKP